ncbi:hypothetical protein [Thalassospira sp. TSL5-1]|uniref:hypothetical protein n=1 Tax=Thalassospira sp. TSL5-1 TaxID=1544451 RepID=UPI00093E7BB5|nr:hypothetical protein [Thalassospira sp. TSL5-1]OKH89301.1 hypothetical protein LF95_04640 [Thalassospira sp. TSL5-1]
MAHFNSPTLEPGFIKPAPLRILARLRDLGTRVQQLATTVLRWYQGQVLMADLSDHLLRDGGLERDHNGMHGVIHRRLPETGHFLGRASRS